MQLTDAILDNWAAQSDGIIERYALQAWNDYDLRLDDSGPIVDRYEWNASDHPRFEAGALGSVGGEFRPANRPGGAISQKFIDSGMSPNATRWIQDSPQGDRQAALQAAVTSAMQTSVQPVVKGKRELAARPDIQKGHHLHLSSLSPNLKGQLLDWNYRMSQLFNPMLIAAGQAFDDETKDAVKEAAWKRMDKAPIRAMLDEMNQMDREARKYGVPLSDFVNANGIIPRELAERLDGGSRFFDPEKLRGKLKAPASSNQSATLTDYKEGTRSDREAMRANPSVREAVERAMGLKPSSGEVKPEPPMEGLVKAPEPKPQAKAPEAKPVVSQWVDKYAQMTFTWDEAAHPREPSGSGKGGEFTKKPSTSKPKMEAASKGGLRVRGTTEDITQCDRCGRQDLKKTIVVEHTDADGNGTGQLEHFGSECIAKIMGKPKLKIEKMAAEADHEAEAIKRDNAARLANRPASTKSEANRNYRKTNRHVLGSYFGEKDGLFVRIDGKDKADVKLFTDAGFRKASEPVDAGLLTEDELRSAKQHYPEWLTPERYSLSCLRNSTSPNPNRIPAMKNQTETSTSISSYVPQNLSVPGLSSLIHQPASNNSSARVFNALASSRFINLHLSKETVEADLNSMRSRVSLFEPIILPLTGNCNA